MSSTDVKQIFVEESSSKVPLDHLDYKYIKECVNTKELSKILRVLRSGEEGYYPDLIRTCEERIQSLDPKSRILRKEKPILRPSDLQRDEQTSISEDIDNFINSSKRPEQNHATVNGQENSLHPIRNSGGIKGKSKQHPAVNGTGDNTTTKKAKLKSWDYKGWDKFNVDEECKKVDEERNEENSAPVRNHNAKPQIKHSLNTANMSEEEKYTRSVSEKDKGNEAFKSADMDEAIAYYTRSISLHPLAAAINNRALAYLKQKKWKKASADCTTVLGMEGESENIKAFLRRATAYKALNQTRNAINDLKFVLEKEPNNAKAKQLMSEVEGALEKEKAEKKTVKPSHGRRMEIVEVDSDSEDEAGVNHTPAVNQVQAVDQVKNLNQSVDNNQTKNVTQTEKPDKCKSEPCTSKEEPTLNSSEKNQVNLVTEHTEVVERKPTTVAITSENLEHELPKIPLPANIDAIKIKGGESFKLGQYAEAEAHYTKAINTLEKLCHGNDEKQKSYLYAKSLLHNNRAACCLKSGHDVGCIKDCNVVLKIRKWDYKALTRRGCAYEHMERYLKAYADFKTALSMNWSDKFLIDRSNSVAKHLRDIHGPKWREHLPDIEVYSPPKGQPVTSGAMAADPVKQELAAKPEVANQEVKIKSQEKKEAVKRDPQEGVTKHKETKKVTAKQKDENQKSIKEIEMEEKKLQIRKNLFEKLKTDGNNLVRKGNYKEAVECYTKCMTMMPEEAASYTNRALCFLKLNKPISAVNDCTKAIEIDPKNVKAYFRRASARKSEKFYKEAERDLLMLLDIEPGNVMAKKELKSVQKFIQTKYSTTNAVSEKVDAPQKQKVASPQKQEVKKEPMRKDSAPPKKKILIEEVSSDEDEPSPPLEPAAGIDVETKKNAKISTPVSDNRQVLIKQPYEFGNLWNAVQNKKDVGKYKDILDRIVPSQLSKLLSNKTDDHVISTICLVCQEYVRNEQNDRALEMLRSLAKADRFSMAGMFMTSEQQKNVKNAINIFSDDELISELMNLYQSVL